MSQAAIRNVRVIGGFLDKFSCRFADGLNCIIGERGAGKSTLIELIRFALDQLPSAQENKAARTRIESLIKKNLGGGRVEVDVETLEGQLYTVRRSWGERPSLWTSTGDPVELPFQTSGLFHAVIYGQNEVEDIASQSLSQLDLIDGFRMTEVGELDAEAARVQEALAANARLLQPLQSEIARLTAAQKERAAIQQQLQDMAPTADKKTAKPVEEGHRLKALRDRENRVIKQAQRYAEESHQQLAAWIGRFSKRIEELVDPDIDAGPNKRLMGELLDALRDSGRKVDRLLREAQDCLAAGGRTIEETQAKLQKTHQHQELDFQQLLESHTEAMGRAAERAELERRNNDLLMQERQLKEKKQERQALVQQRTDLLRELSELRDRRHQVRAAVARQINDRLSPLIKVDVEQEGDRTAYEAKLNQALRTAGVRRAQVAERLVSVHPWRLATLVRSRDVKTLTEEGGVNREQAKRVIQALVDSPTLYELEGTELPDLPCIQLLDGEYKPASELSTGQKCTAMLPILLWDSRYPVCIDQVEDNLDIRCLADVIEKSIIPATKERQMIVVTHNANLPVLGEASYLLVLKSDGNQAKKIDEGSVDHCKDYILSYLEGGKEAFTKRRDKYGLNQP